MTVLKSIAILFCLAAVAVIVTPVAQADNWNQRTEMYFSQPVEIPGIVLPAGSYWFVLRDDQSDRNIVEVLDASQSKLYANLIAIPTVRTQVTDETVVVFAERQHTQPEALWKWYYPGWSTGHEFIYPHREQQRLRRDIKQVVLVHPISGASNTIQAGE
jgi:hypothetical protein